MSAIAGPACFLPSAFFIYVSPFETSPTKCIGLCKLLSFRKGYLEKFLTQIQLVVILAEGTSDSPCIGWAAVLDGVSSNPRGTGRHDSRSKVPSLPSSVISSSRVDLVLSFFYLQSLRRSHRITCDSRFSSHKILQKEEIQS